MKPLRDSFIIFKNWADAINALPEEYQLETYKALVEYGITGEMPENLSPIANAMLISFSVGMENSIVRYNNSVENGKKGGRPKKEQNPEEPKETQDNNLKTQGNPEKPRETRKNPDITQKNPDITQDNPEEPRPNLNVNDNVNVNVNVNDNVNILKKTLSIERVKESSQSALSPPSNKNRFKKPTIEDVEKFCKENKININAKTFLAFYEAKGWKLGNQSMRDWKAAIVVWNEREKMKNKKDFMERNNECIDFEFSNVNDIEI